MNMNKEVKIFQGRKKKMNVKKDVEKKYEMNMNYKEVYTCRYKK